VFGPPLLSSAAARSFWQGFVVGPLPSIAVADALLDERRELAEWA